MQRCSSALACIAARRGRKGKGQCSDERTLLLLDARAFNAAPSPAVRFQGVAARRMPFAVLGVSLLFR